MASDEKEKMVKTFKKKKFSLLTDGSNNISDKKLYPLVNSYFDDKQRVNTTLLSLLESSDNTGKGFLR